MGEHTRRTFLGTVVTAAATPVLAASDKSAAGKGPLVWLDMDQAELDAAYDQTVHAPNLQQVVRRCNLQGDDIRARLGAPKRFKYGPAEAEGLDVYATDRPNAPVHVFVHGGAWRGGSAHDHGFPAEMFMRAGAHYLAVDFSPVQEFGGNLTAVVEQLRRAIVWVARNAQSFGGDAGRIYLSGHSSGGHLAGVLLTTDWTRHGLPADVIKGGLCISGMFDLKPVRLSARRLYIDFNDEMEDALSAQRHIDRLHAPLVLACGTLETREFQRHTRDFHAAVKAAGKPVQLVVADSFNHLEIVETLGNPYGLMGRAALAQMKLG